MEKDDAEPMKTEDMFDAVIVAGGDFPVADRPLEVLENAPYVVCCDGAADRYIATGRVPDAIVGDGDSLPETLKQQYAHLLHLEDEQDYNDMTKATRFCMQRGARKIAYIGATGKREDHTLGNISLLAYYVQTLHIRPTLYTDYGTFLAIQGTQSFTSLKGQQVSLFNIDCTEMESTGLKWPVFAAKTWWQTSLNEALSDQFSITANGTYLVFRTYETK